MDERMFTVRKGRPIPEWDDMHRLHTSSFYGRVCGDSGTVFRFNSIFMDITDQPHLARHYFGTGIILSIICSYAILALSVKIFCSESASDSVRFVWVPLYALLAIPFLYIVLRWFRSEFFALTFRPFRFHRQDQKIYAMRGRLRKSDGDQVWTIPWNEESMFCVHRGERNNAHTYHIRYYEVDEHGKVIRGCSIGRDWEGDEALPLLFAQWNYWCLYMREGPANLPLPGLFVAERETLLESFLTCMYWMGGTVSPATRILMMPFFFTFTVVRVLALMTCRAPVWPETIDQRCQVRSDDVYAQPNESMPIGWGATTLARQENRYPRDPKVILDEYVPVEVSLMTESS